MKYNVFDVGSELYYLAHFIIYDYKEEFDLLLDKINPDILSLKDFSIMQYLTESERYYYDIFKEKGYLLYYVKYCKEHGKDYKEFLNTMEVQYYD